MYHLSKSIYLWATAKEEYSILLLGLDNAGKTTLLASINSHFSAAPLPTKPALPTVGQNVSTIELPDMYLKLWDVGGQENLRDIWKSYFDVCHAIVFVVDGCDIGEIDDDVQDMRSSRPGRASRHDSWTEGNTDTNMPASPFLQSGHEYGRLDECRRALEEVLRHPATANVPLLVLANKQDREDCMETIRIKEGLVRKVFESSSGAGVRDSRVLPVSALKGDGVREAVEWLQSRVKWNREAREPVMR